MGDLVDLAEWRRTRAEDLTGTDPGIRRLELAVAELDAAASARMDRSGRLERSVETELLAILGALAADLIEEASNRAERLAGRLAR
ncbi:MAG TPA: hypothetical protein VF972_11810 [Actinomycetota bacterium]